MSNRSKADGLTPRRSIVFKIPPPPPHPQRKMGNKVDTPRKNNSPITPQHRKYYPAKEAYAKGNGFMRSFSSLPPLPISSSTGYSPKAKRPRFSKPGELSFKDRSFMSLPLSPSYEKDEDNIDMVMEDADPDSQLRDYNMNRKLNAIKKMEGNEKVGRESYCQSYASTSHQMLSESWQSNPVERSHDFLEPSPIHHCLNTSTGPITSAVLKLGLRNPVRSFSSCFLSDHNRAPSSCWSFGWHNPLRSSSSVTSESSKWRSASLTTSLRNSIRAFGKRKLDRNRSSAQSEATVSDAGSIASLNSLSDGRTPWPTPWLEAIFLPEYPNKGPVNEKLFQVLGTIASGAFGKVFRVCLSSDASAVFAMKVQNKSDIISKNAVQQMKDEVSIHECLSVSTFIAKIYASWQSRIKLYTVVQYVTGYGDLYQLWRDEGPLKQDVVKIYATEIIIALDFMHSSGVIYRDLKLENIMLDDNGHIQMVDFGLAKWLSLGGRTRTICGTLQYMAPEIARGDNYDHAVDWWSLGVLIHLLLIGSYPFPPAKDHINLKFDSYIPPQELSPDAKDFLQQLLTLDSYYRLSNMTSAQNHKFLAAVNVDLIAEKKIHPFDYIVRMRKCISCNVTPSTPIGDVEEEEGAFDEGYDAFSNFDYFYDDITTHL